MRNSRYQKLKDSLSEEDKQLLNKFIESKKLEKIFVLKFGEIEDYFPEISKNRSLESIVEFVTAEKFDEWYKATKKNDERKDLEFIILNILNNKE